MWTVASVVWVATCATLVSSAATRAEPSAFAACAASGKEWSYDDLLCIYRVGIQHNARPEARKRLRALGAGDANHAWATLVLAHVTLNDDDLDAIRLYEMAANGFVRARAAEGEVVARQNLRMVYQRRGMADAAARQVALATAAADASKQPLAIVRASVLEASHLLEVGGDVGRAERALLRAAQLSFPSGPIALRRAVLFNLGLAHLYLGRLDAAIDAWERHRALRKEDGSTTDASAVAFNLLNARMTQHEMRPVPSARARLLAHAEDLVAEAQTPPRPFIEAQAHRLLADLLKPSDPDRAIAHLQRCLEIEAPLGHPNVRAACLWALSRHEATRNPVRADEFSRDAIELVAANRSALLLAFAWQARLRMVWQTLDEERAINDSLEALAAIERFRAGQKDEASRAALFSGWTRDYYWLTGRLLDLQPPRIGTAFAVGERLRSRVLLDRLTSAGIPHDEDATAAVARQQLTARLAKVQRRLLSATLAASERAALVDQLALLELERQEIGDGGAPAADVEALPFASLDAVQQTLGPGEAMLWYSIAPWKNLYDEFGGGAWVLAITRDDVKMQRLDTRVEIDSQIAALTGLLSARDTSPAVWSTPAKQLGHRLLASALAALPRAVDRLVIVSDGALHRLPFEALPVGDDARPLGERFEIAVVPSATLWLRLRRAAAQSPAGTAFVLADPDVPRGTPTEHCVSTRCPGRGARRRPLPVFSISMPARSSRAATRLNAGSRTRRRAASFIWPRMRGRTTRSRSARRCSWRLARRTRTAGCNPARLPRSIFAARLWSSPRATRRRAPCSPARGRSVWRVRSSPAAPARWWRPAGRCETTMPRS